MVCIDNTAIFRSSKKCEKVGFALHLLNCIKVENCSILVMNAMPFCSPSDVRIIWRNVELNIDHPNLSLEAIIKLL